MLIYVDGTVVDVNVIIYEPFPEKVAEITQTIIEDEGSDAVSES